MLNSALGVKLPRPAEPPISTRRRKCYTHTRSGAVAAQYWSMAQSPLMSWAPGRSSTHPGRDKRELLNGCADGRQNHSLPYRIRRGLVCRIVTDTQQRRRGLIAVAHRRPPMQKLPGTLRGRFRRPKRYRQRLVVVAKSSSGADSAAAIATASSMPDRYPRIVGCCH